MENSAISVYNITILEIVTTDTKEIYKCPCVICKFLSVFLVLFCLHLHIYFLHA